MHALLLTAAGRRILVPRALVAEVVSATVLELAADGASGLEEFSWRGRRVPLLRAAALAEAPAPAAAADGQPEETAIAVFHGLRQQAQLPFYGLLVAHSPRVLRLGEDDLEEVTGVPLPATELMRVRVQGEDASIPRVDQLESNLLALMQGATTRQHA